MSFSSNPDFLTILAEQSALTIPEECVPGVRANLELLQHHAAVVAVAEEALIEPAEILRP